MLVLFQLLLLLLLLLLLSLLLLLLLFCFYNTTTKWIAATNIAIRRGGGGGGGRGKTRPENKRRKIRRVKPMAFSVANAPTERNSVFVYKTCAEKRLSCSPILISALLK